MIFRDPNLNAATNLLDFSLGATDSLQAAFFVHASEGTLLVYENLVG